MLRSSKTPGFNIPKLDLKRPKINSISIASTTRNTLHNKLSSNSSIHRNVMLRRFSSNVKISPIEAQKILKEDILDRVSKFGLLTNRKNRNKGKYSQRDNSTNLSTQLIEQITEAKATIAIKRQRLHLERKKHLKLLKDVKHLKFKISDVSYQLHCLQLERKHFPSSLSANTEKIHKLTTQCELSFANKKAVMQQLIEEIEFKDSSENERIHYTHSNSSVEMHNSILGECLKGLFYTFQFLRIDTLQGHLTDLYRRLSSVSAEIVNRNEMKMTTLKVFEDLNSQKGKSTHQVSHLRSKLVRDIYLKISHLKDRAKHITSKITLEVQKAEKYSEAHARLQTKYRNLNLRYLRDWHSLKELLNLNSRAVREQGEDICINCGSVFDESNQFSCYVHRSEWNGNEYWCCGNKNVDAPGCCNTKHQSKAHLDNDSQDNSIDVVCTSCKNHGHLCSECPNDPNVRSNFNLNDELNRTATVSFMIHKKSFLFRFITHLKKKREKLKRHSGYLDRQGSQEHRDKKDSKTCDDHDTKRRRANNRANTVR